ncbi:hypothetical protein L596_003996 [Steinernema carpocapsae]|uniref:Uncharacterized protein n=1 Tax=Steinernema carpocapsae TaxID=34508 RepID=A0A4U8UUH4_STECR|nr:hypothetical protein L596_003996 [Steinernema carpocapsae]
MSFVINFLNFEDFCFVIISCKIRRNTNLRETCKTTKSACPSPVYSSLQTFRLAIRSIGVQPIVQQQRNMSRSCVRPLLDCRNQSNGVTERQKLALN